MKNQPPEKPGDQRRVTMPRSAMHRPRVALVTCSYYLVREIAAALDRLGIPHADIPLRDDAGAFARSVAETVMSFRPTVLLTVNRYGLDDSGRVAEMLRKLSMSAVCWLVDSADILLGGLDGPEEGLCYATCDKAAVPFLSSMSAAPALYLPLATDPYVFKPGPSPKGHHPWRSRVSFVGHSWVGNIEANCRTHNYPPALLAGLDRIAAAWEREAHTPFGPFLAAFDPALHELAAGMDAQRRKWFAALAQWKAASLRRVRMVAKLMPFEPLIVGDAPWDALLGGAGTFRRVPELDYATDLPRFYPLAEVNFNCTSPQMSMALNQRVFDIPACGGFVLTERRPELEELFDIDTEAVCYDGEDGITDAVSRCLGAPAKRQAVVVAARRRILAQHTYEHRLRSLFAHLKAQGV